MNEALNMQLSDPYNRTLKLRDPFTSVTLALILNVQLCSNQRSSAIASYPTQPNRNCRSLRYFSQGISCSRSGSRRGNTNGDAGCAVAPLPFGRDDHVRGAW